MDKKALLRQVGVTPEGTAVLAGVYRFYETTGLPLEVLFDELVVRNAIPCWVTFHRDGQRAGMKHSRILSMLREAMLDNYSRACRDRVLENLVKLHEIGHPCLDLSVPWRHDL